MLGKCIRKKGKREGELGKGVGKESLKWDGATEGGT